MDGIGIPPHAGTSSSSQTRENVCIETRRASALSAELERGRVKLQHRHNTMLYYASSRNQSNAKPLALVCNTMPLPSSALGLDANNEPASAFTPPVVAKTVGDSAAVAGSPTLSSNARHEGHADCIVMSSTSKDGGAKTANDLEEVSVPNSNEDYDVDCSLVFGLD